jgi:hypothetical protein
MYRGLVRALFLEQGHDSAFAPVGRWSRDNYTGFGRNAEGATLNKPLGLLKGKWGEGGGGGPEERGDSSARMVEKKKKK